MRYNLTELLILIVGCGVYAVSVIFIEPVSVVTGGALGICIVCNKLFGTPMGLANLLINIPIMFFCIKILGKKSLAYTGIIIVLTSVMIDSWGKWIPALPFNNQWIVMAISGVLMGISCGVLMSIGGTFGGSSTVVCILKHHFPGINAGNLQFIIDGSVVLLGVLLLRSFEALLLSIAYTLIYSKIIGLIFNSEKSEKKEMAAENNRLKYYKV